MNASLEHMQVVEEMRRTRPEIRAVNSSTPTSGRIVSITEQRGLASIAHSWVQHGLGSQRRRLHEPIIRAGATVVAVPVFKRGATPRRSIHMLYTIAVILLVAWLLGLVGLYTIGSFVHVLLAVAIVLFLVRVLRGRRVLG
jgi:Flp pilus assembly protein TadB